MNSNKHSEQYRIGDKDYCVNEPTYEQHLTKRREYIISNIGSSTKEGKLRIKGDSGKLVWISDLHFSRNNQPEIVSINVDD